MNPYSLSLFTFAIWLTFLAIFIQWRRRDIIGVRWLHFSIAASIWAAGWGIMLRDQTDPETALWAARIATSAGVLVPAPWLLFCYSFLNLPTSKKMVRTLYLIGSIGAVLAISPFMVAAVRPYMGFLHHAKAGPLFFLKDLFFGPVVAFGFFLLLKRYLKAADREREMLGFFLIATSIGFGGGTFTHFCIYGIPIKPWPIFFLPLYPFFMVGALLNHRLLDTEELEHLAGEAKLATLGTLSAGILHEIKNPLYLMQNIALSRTDPDTPVGESVEALEKIEGYSRRTLEVIECLKTFAAPSNKETAREADVNTCLSFALELLAPLLRGRNIEIKRRGESLSAKVAVNPRRLEQILVNLIQNACEASSVGGIIEMDVEVSGREVSIHIKDYGSGISREDEKKIFEPFHTTKLGQGGTGLGLFITKQLVEAEGGVLKLATKSGIGSTFSVIFPVKLGAVIK